MTTTDQPIAYEAVAPTSAAPVPVPGAPVENRLLGHPVARVLKRAEDLIGCLLALPLLLVVMPLIALVVRIDSKGPVFFRQRRVGRDGEIFLMFKFRSMCADAEDRLRADPELYQEWLANDYKLPPERDPRMTKVGRFLRRSSLDELPQVLNVLVGDMSLVGPRPVVEPELDRLYGTSADVYCSVRPGLTGLWQVSGRSSVTGRARADLDVEYVRTWSPLRDAVIVLRTIPAVLRQRGAH